MDPSPSPEHTPKLHDQANETQAHLSRQSSFATPPPRLRPSKPIKKNDTAAKLALIAEIEHYWGKNFIRTYIPKCHRPLVKKTKAGKKTTCRARESDPVKWLPSALKAVLGTARLTRDRTWLRGAMEEVVRWRIRNTGNRKPQLVTTDFDVLEDMLVKNWDVKYSFSIRYKHLLVNPQGLHDTDEDIDHILGVGEDSDDDDIDHILGVERDEGEDEGQVTEKYPDAYSSPQPAQHRLKTPPRLDKHSHAPAYPYNPPYALDLWGRPVPAYPPVPSPEGYSYSHNYGGYGITAYPPQPPTQHHAYSSPGYNYPPGRQTPAPTPSPSSRTQSHTHPASSPFTLPFPFTPPSHPHPATYPPTPRPGIKQESPPPSPTHQSTRSASISHATPSIELDAQTSTPHSHSHTHTTRPETETDMEMKPDFHTSRVGSVGTADKAMSAAALEAELRAAELELRVARLQARRAALRRGKD